jgi:hypothetical protein
MSQEQEHTVIVSCAQKGAKDSHGNSLRRRYGTFLSTTKDCECGEILHTEVPQVFTFLRQGDDSFMKTPVWRLVDKILQDKVPLEDFFVVRIDERMLFNYTKIKKFTADDEEAIQKLCRLHNVLPKRVRLYYSFVRAYAIEGQVKVDNEIYEHAGLCLQLFGFANHCCLPNAMFKLSESKGVKAYTLISTMPIEKGAQVTVAYTPFAVFMGNQNLKEKTEGAPFDFDTMVDIVMEKPIESRLADLYTRYGFACSCDYCFAVLEKNTDSGNTAKSETGEEQELEVTDTGVAADTQAAPASGNSGNVE